MRRAVIVLARALLCAGLLAAAGCATRPAAPVAQPASQDGYRVKASLLNLLQCPNVNCDVIEDLHQGQEVAVLSPVMNGWIMVRVKASGHEGYVEARFINR
jgi:hypothetical protein